MKISRKRFAVPVTVALLLVAAMSVSAVEPDVVDNYYTDGTFTVTAGWSERYCDGTYEYGAPFTTYRYHQISWCGSTQHSENCQYFDGSTWVNMTCPSGMVLP